MQINTTSAANPKKKRATRETQKGKYRGPKAKKRTPDYEPDENKISQFSLSDSGFKAKCLLFVDENEDLDNVIKTNQPGLKENTDCKNQKPLEGSILVESPKFALNSFAN